ncbi:hypothetical protein K461DRAFT_231837 [Myriangium duriaei CBS 260.36]|uniref:Vps41 beta-propeller domain-containing protein n=1 Tax=Myriangium duriaei CBS 260.36 TaxID=1168546 RepID=A0A9P4IUD0_9PEZI|nr:hypothetical protein K461DRAFT_231837 [Myriangium duriaei CBS 260.36]
MTAAPQAPEHGNDSEDAPRTPPKNGAKVPVTDPESDDEDDEDQEEEEPQLKYTKLTGSLSSVYRNDDDTSTFFVGGDKLIVGTHNGNIHTLSLTSLQPLRTYHAHSASITALSISPVPPPPVLGASSNAVARLQQEAAESIKSSSSPAPSSSASKTAKPLKKHTLPNTPSNQIYIASASVDGHVCVSSLADPNDVTLRNFARPVQAVALSPEYKYDRTYLSGGLAGNLILTVGGKAGVSADANTNSAAAAAQGWLGSIGLGSNTGKDTILHSGEGGIASIKFSRTGKFVAWINEHGIKIMRSHMKLDSGDLGFAWKRIAHVDRPGTGVWEEMAAVWKGRMEWVSDKNLEHDDVPQIVNGSISTIKKTPPHKRRPEKLIVGWGDTVWILHVHVGGTGVGKHAGERTAGSVDVVHKLTFDDCILSGLSLYTPSLLAVLAYRTRDDDNRPIAANNQGTPRRHRQSALSPELRLVEVASGEEVDVDTLSVSRYESLSATDYHLGSLYIPAPVIPEPLQRGALESLNAGFWDMSANATRMFSSGASVRSLSVNQENGRGSARSPSASIVNARGAALARLPSDSPPALSSSGLKLFIQTPYDCVLAVKRNPSDHLSWLMDHHKYEKAWELLDEHPEIVKPSDSASDSSPGTPTNNRGQGTLADFFADDGASQTTLSLGKVQNSAIAKEKRKIGDLWLQQLVTAKDWKGAGEVAGKVLGTSSRWEHWVLVFAQANRFDEITPFIPSTDMRPPLPSFVYEVVLGHYITTDPSRFADLLEKWDPELFDISSVTTAIETRLDSGEVTEDGDTSEDWRTLTAGLAKLKLAGGQPRQALRCYIRLQNAEAAMSLIKDYHLTDAITDDIPGLLMLRVNRDSLTSGSIPDMRDSSAEAISLLVEEAYSGIVQPSSVVSQLAAKGDKYSPFTYLYFALLWRGPVVDEDRVISKVERLNLERLTTEGRIIVEEFADLALSLFAQYDRDLLSLYLRTSTAYALDKATSICEERSLIPELVYLLSKTGQTKKALFLIIEKLADVSQAISFAKEHPDLWDDLLDYSMDKPRFIRALLHEIGTSVDAVKLVKRIPEGLEIEGLKEGVQKMVREYDIQFSISEGVARVLRGEVAAGMEVLREGRRRGVKFDVRHRLDEVEVKVDPALNTVDEELKKKGGMAVPDLAEGEALPEPGYCVSCSDRFEEDGTLLHPFLHNSTLKRKTDFLIGFACGHVFHLDCLLDRIKASRQAHSLIDDMRAQTRRDSDGSSDDNAEVGFGALTRSVGPKISHAQVIRSAIGGGCPVCSGKEE